MLNAQTTPPPAVPVAAEEIQGPSIKPVRTLLAARHDIVRAGYRALLLAAPDIEVVAEAVDGPEAMAAFFQFSPDVAVLDLSLRGVSGIEAIRRIVARRRRARLLALSLHEDLVFVEQALKAGARGFLSMDNAADEMVQAIRAVAAGRIVLDDDVARRLATRTSGETATAFAALSPREFEIMRMIVTGHTIERIAEHMDLRYRTIANYGTQIRIKLGCATLPALTRLAIREGIIKP